MHFFFKFVMNLERQLSITSLLLMLFQKLLHKLLFQGGLKTAILTDVMQGLTMIAVSLAIILQGCLEAGGIQEVVTINRNDGRLKFFK